jgi:hypothetical protein
LAPERQTAEEGGQQLGNYPLANEFAANIDVTDMGANCEGGEQTSLNEKRRFVIDNVTILADSRLALVRIRGRSSGAFDELAEKANPLRGAWDRT